MSSVSLQWIWAFQPFLLIILLAGSRASSAILEPGLEAAVPFYKSPQSHFPSGQTRKSLLMQSQQGSYTNFQYKARWGQKTISIKNENILRELDVALKVRIRKKTPLLLMPELGSSTLLTLQQGQTLEVESRRGAWARVKATALHKGYVLLSDLESTEDDKGVWLGLSELVLRKTPTADGEPVVTLPAFTRLQLLHYHGDYAFLKTDSKSGYAPLHEIVGRVDFAQWAWDLKTKKWETVLYRNGASVFLKGNRKKALLDFTAFRGSKNRALITGEHSVAGRGARVDLIEPTAVKWTQSLIKDHGAVWWKIDLLEKDSQIGRISTQELMKRNLKGISFDPKTKKGLASANGIYRTLDGKNWDKIAFFGQDNWPVSLHPSGVWFVGHYRSTDEGATFKPSIRWSELIELLQGSRSKSITHFRVLDIENTSETHVSLKVDTGITVVQIQAPVLGNYWTLLKKPSK